VLIALTLGLALWVAYGAVRGDRVIVSANLVAPPLAVSFSAAKSGTSDDLTTRRRLCPAWSTDCSERSEPPSF